MKYEKNTVNRALVSFRERLNDFSTPKNEKVIQYFQSFSESDDEAYSFCDRDRIAAATGLTRTRVNEVIRNLYACLLENLSEETCRIKEAIICIWIYVPWDESETRGHGGNSEYLDGKAVTFYCTLPVIPRIGEEITLDFIDWNAHFRHGYVFRVSHVLSGDEQRIDVHVHPFEKPYRRWHRMKQEFEREERHKKWIEWEEQRMQRNSDNAIVSTKVRRRKSR